MALLAHQEFEQQLARGNYCPVYLLNGPEEYLHKQALVSLKSAALNPETISFNYAEFEASTDSSTEVLQALDTLPVYSRYRLVLLQNVQLLAPGDQDALLSYVSSPRARSILVLAANELDRRTAFYRYLREKACVVELPKLKGYGLFRWAENYLRARGYRLSSTGLRKLVGLVGSDLRALANELEKLLLYSGEDKEISNQAVDELVQHSRQHGIFELINALGRKDHQAALNLLGNLLDSGEPPLMIVTMMARHFRQTIIAKELLERDRPLAEIAAAARIPSFILEEFITQVRHMDSAVARDMYVRLALIDYRLKSSSASPRLILEHMICAL